MSSSTYAFRVPAQPSRFSSSLPSRPTITMNLPSSDQDSAKDFSNDHDEVKSQLLQGRRSSQDSTDSITQLTAEEEAAQATEGADAAQQAENTIAVDNNRHSSFSDAGYVTDSVGSASTSLASTVRDYTFENGRRYHKFREGVYNFPNDDSEQDREDMKHAMMVNLCQQLHFAPIGENPQNILDMGTGTGIWAIESECTKFSYK